MRDEFETCTNCIHSDDAEPLCILRLCKHAIAEMKECYEPKSQPEVAKDCISRQGAIDFFLKKGMITSAIYVERMPSAQPERKKGKWIDVNDGKWNTIEVLKCSVCGEIDNRMNKTDNFCPSCGANMRGEQNE